MQPTPIALTKTKIQIKSLEKEVDRLRSLVLIEQKARAQAESDLLVFDLAQKNGDPPRSRMAMIAGLVNLAKSRDSGTGDHLTRIQHYTVLIATAYAKSHPELLPMGEVSIIGAASVLHDIGKVGVCDDILLYEGKYSRNQFDEMKHHAMIGTDILISLSEQIGRDPWIDTAIQITIGHHERWDGTGYPYGTKGEGIDLSARIVAVADVYDALTTKRFYKNALSHDETVDIILSEKGAHFDPMVIDAFLLQANELNVVSQRLNRSKKSIPEIGIEILSSP